MNGAIPGKYHTVSNRAMSPDHGPVSKDTMIANQAIMGDMTVRHEIIVATDASGPGVRGPAMDGDALAEDIMIADFQPSRLSLVF
jgi:hypothetical protein